MKQYTLSLTADELDWLLFEIMERAAQEADAADAIDIRISVGQWFEQVAKQGYRQGYRQHGERCPT